MNGIALLVGLGNPGAEHALNRHNAGFWLLDALADQHGARFGADAKLHGESVKLNIAGQPVWLLKPRTFMNRSGQAVVAAQHYFRIAAEQTLVVHDDLDLPTGVARLKFDGGHGGQNGLRDIIATLGHGRFHRLRIGIGHPGDKNRVTSWVLGRPGKEDEARMRAAVSDAQSVMESVVGGDFEGAMRWLHASR
ncbi:MAG: aminoacyl-tRNA hydrolase [Lysobacterales bacterium]